MPALLIAPDGRTEFLEGGQGVPLGIVRSARYESARTAFQAGSSLLLYTDGLVERRRESIDEGLGRLREATESVFSSPDGVLADRVYNRLLEKAMLDSATLEDDVALLAIESLPLGAQLDMTLDARPAVLAGLRRLVGRWLSDLGVAPDDLFSVTLAISEAAANAIEHAYGGHEGTFRVTCEQRRDDGAIVVTVSDHGRWRESRPYGRGRGLAIMRSLVDEVDVRRGDETGTSVTLTKLIPADSR